MINFQNKGTSF